jgi:CBS domain-containing protein
VTGAEAETHATETALRRYVYQPRLSRTSMDDIFVARLMSTSLHTVSPDTLVEDAAKLMMDEGIGSVVVVDDDNQLCGILTTTDFVRIVAERKPKDQTPVSEYMTADVVTTTAQVPIREVADTMMNHGFHHVPVVDEDEGVIGMITTTDLAAYLSTAEAPSPS